MKEQTADGIVGALVAIVAGSIECTSLPEGMRCWDFQYGGEFTISREGYQLA